jgi:sugar lactone lactonase YvrE
MSARARKAAIPAALALAALAASEPPPRPAYPASVALDATGNLFVADPLLPGVIRVDLDGSLRTVSRGVARDRSPLRGVRALAVGDGGGLFAADTATGEVYRLRPGAAPAAMTGGAFEVPTGLAIGPNGDLLVTDLRLGVVARVPRGGGKPVTIARVPSPRGVAVTRSGGIVVLSMGRDALVRVQKDGAVSPLVTGRPFRFPVAVAVDPEGEGDRFVVSDAYAATVWSVSGSGEVWARVQGKPLMRPGGLAFDPSGALLVADPGARQVFRFARDGTITTRLPAPPSDPAGGEP